MNIIERIANVIPEVVAPLEKKLPFSEKLIWTGVILVLFFALGLVPLFGMDPASVQQFEFLSVLLGANFGSLISLGIGPLVTASIVLQLLNGSGILKFDLASHEGRSTFQGVQKLLSIFFIIFEASIYVFMGGLAPPRTLQGTSIYTILQLMLVVQITIGGLLIMFMDQVVSKWGFGSGVSLFIAANVSQSLVIQTISPLASPTNPNIATGAIPALIQSFIRGDPQTAFLKLIQIGTTILVFLMAVYAQAMKIEIPLSLGRVRGYGIRWPLNFIYTSNIPVILVAALIANVQLWARLLQNWGHPIFGTFIGNSPATGLVWLLSTPRVAASIIQQTFTLSTLIQAITFTAFMIIGSIIFSWFWVQTAGMDAKSQAKQIMKSKLQIPGFRKDERVLEHLLERYITPLTVMGAIAVGALASLADILGALTSGTGLLLTVMIVYKLYEDIARQHMMDMNPALRKFMGG